MKKEYLKRIKFVSENKMVVDGEHKVTKNAGPKKGFIFNGKDGSKLKFQTEEELFEFLDEMTDSSSAGGMELPFVPASDSEFKNRKAAPYNQVVTGLYTESEAVALAEKMVKEALVSEASGDYPAKEMIEKYKAANKKESEKAIKDIEEGIKIVYEKPLAAFPPNYYRDDNDYNKDGVPNQYKNNNTLLDLKYDGITDEAKEWFTSQIKAGGKTAEDMAKAAKRKAEIQDKNPLNDAVYVGNDMELSKVNTEKSKDGMPRTGVAMLGFSLNENKMYKFKFESDKYDFGRNRAQLAEAIPNKVKQDNTKFQMQDGKGNLFMLEWANGEAVILEHRNLIAEQKLNEKVDKLFNYNNTEKRPKQKKVDFDYFTKEKKDLKESVENESLTQYGIKELRDGLTFEDIKTKFPWILEAKIENAVLGLLDKKFLIWYDVDWYDGDLYKSIWKNGRWYSGSWYDGIWYDGIWKGGEWKNGIWKNGIWNYGHWEKGVWYDGIWKNGIWDGGYWFGGTWEQGKIPDSKLRPQGDTEDYITVEFPPNKYKYLQPKTPKKP